MPPVRSMSVAPEFPPVNPRPAGVRSAVDVCILTRSSEMDGMESRLRLAVVDCVRGARPHVSCTQAADAILTRLDIPRHAFSVHKFHPEDFLMVLSTPEFRNRVLSSPDLEGAGFKLFFKPWLRQAQANSRLMRVMVDLMIEGIPPHAWSRAMAEEVLGSS